MRPLRLAAAGAVLAVGLTVAPSAAAPVGPKPVGSPAADCRAKVAGLDLQTATVEQLQAAMKAGRLTSRALTQAYLKRIRAYDGATNSVRVVSPAALAEADRADRERRAGKARGPLHGIPVLLKDNIGTRTVPTTAGSIALEGNVPKQEAFVTQRLRAAGAVVLGKTNLSEFANWMQLGQPNGWSSLGGQVRNAYDEGDPSGSSSGSGVAGSMAFATATLGSETSGSILSPSEVNGLVGVKPTLGLTSRAGVIPLAASFDVVGPMTRNVTDAAAVLTAIAGTDPRDAATKGAQAADYLKGLKGASLQGVRLGYDPSFERDPMFARALEDLATSGAELVADDLAFTGTVGLTGLTEIGEIPNEFKTGLNDYLADRGGATSERREDAERHHRLQRAAPRAGQVRPEPAAGQRRPARRLPVHRRAGAGDPHLDPGSHRGRARQGRTRRDHRPGPGVRERRRGGGLPDGHRPERHAQRRHRRAGAVLHGHGVRRGRPAALRRGVREGDAAAGAADGGQPRAAGGLLRNRAGAAGVPPACAACCPSSCCSS
jgi:Asp-tRNA(Asn)/Glu-tRNA(Gln) amidotransferase A subunit family amidase